MKHTNEVKKAKKSYKSWAISAEFWDAVKDEIPQHKREEGREYGRKPGAGRKPPDKRGILGGILHVLRTGCQWKSIPMGGNVHRYFLLWQEAGFFERIWAKGLEEYDELKGIDREWQSLDGCMTKAPLARESVGANPTDRGKKWKQAQPPDGRARPAHRVRHVGGEHA
jgi:transposase